MGHSFPQVDFVRVLAGRIGDDEKAVPEPGNHEIVANSSMLVGKQCISLPPRSKANDIHGYDRFQRTRYALAVAVSRSNFELSHMGHVEKSSCRADVKVFFQDSIRVLNGHLVSRKGNHPSAKI
jgi:hypothetical protein